MAKSKTTLKKKTGATKRISKEVTIDRRSRADRPVTEDLRQAEIDDEYERREMPERRIKVNRRRQIDPTTCERDYSNDEIEFMHALDVYKRDAGRMFPTCSEVLEVLRDMGYRRLTPEELAKIAPPQQEMAEGENPNLQPTETAKANAEELLEETLEKFEG